MRVYVNGKQVLIFRGARVIDALRRVFVRRKMDLHLIDNVTVYDSYGNEIATDGRMKDDQRITFKFMDENEITNNNNIEEK